MSNDLPTDNFSGNAAKSLHSGMSWGQSYRWGGGRTNSTGAFLDLDQVKHPFLPLSKVTMLSSGRALEP